MRFQSLLVAVVATVAQGQDYPKARSFIYVVPDGYGIASQVMARDFYSITGQQGTVNRPNSAQLGVDSMVIGTVRTQASDNLITDSAASATAFSAGIKTYNGAIGVDDNGEPVGTILEAAHLAGFKTGLVVTSRITHATPGAYAAHVAHRDSETDIAGQQIGYTHPLGSVVDFLAGGGRRNYLPADAGGSRTDGVNLVEWAQKKGFNYAADKSDFDSLAESGKVDLPFLGLFTSSHMSYELDRNPEDEPSLLEMAKIAVDSLQSATADAEQGFFVMIEASRIDHAGHANDAAAHVHETIMFNEVMAYLKEYVSSHPDTQLLSAADHECGGLTLRDIYDPSVLARPQHSTEYLEYLFDAYEGSDRAGYFREVILPGYGVTTATGEQIDLFLQVYRESGSFAMGSDILAHFAEDVGAHFSTGDHTAADVILHGFAAGERFNQMKVVLAGNRNNIELPRYIEEVLGLDMATATEAIRRNGTDWVKRENELHVMRKRANFAAKAHNSEHKH